MIIDTHVHIGPWEYPPFYKIASSLEETIKLYKKWGISGAVITRSDSLSNEKLLKTIKRQQDRKFKIWFFPWVNSNRDLSFLQKEKKFITGIKIHPSFSKKPITDKSFKKILKFASSERIPILVHSGRWIEVAGYQYILKCASLWPTVNFIVAHAGGANTTLKMELIKEIKKKKFNNIYLEISGMFEYWILERGLKLIPKSKFFFGSDFPTIDPRIIIAVIKYSNINTKIKRDILANNFLKFIKRYNGNHYKFKK